jgi:hypothetical protein
MLTQRPNQPSSLALVAHVARLLASDHPFEARVGGMFTLMRDVIGFHDGRLTCWAADTAVHTQIHANNGW